MLKYFPSRYDDELLYSIVSRYAYDIGISSMIHILNEIFDKYNSILSIDLPCRIEKLINKIPRQVDITVEDIIYSNTMFSLFHPFLDIERQKKIYKTMLGEQGKDIHMTIGSMASRIQSLKYLRYCPECIVEDLKKYGEPYWHRSHNIDGVYICHKHNCWLSEKDDNGEYINNICQRKLISLSEVLKDKVDLEGKVPICKLNIDAHKKQLLFNISKGIYEILNYEFYKSNIDVKRVHEIYKDKLLERGLMLNADRVNQIQVRQEIRKYYGDDILQLLNLTCTSNEEWSWIKGLINSRKKINHPLKHIVIINWLYDGDISRFIEEIKEDKISIRERLWPCLNPAAEHYGKHIIKSYKLKFNCKKKYYFLVFKCSCGYTYTRRLEDINDINKKSRVLQYGTIWEAKLVELLQQGDRSINGIAKELQVDASTVKAYGIKLGVLEAKDKDNEKLRTETKYKKKPQNKVSVEKKDTTGRNQYYKQKIRADWKTRDKEIYQLVKNEIEHIKQLPKCRRITISAIGTNIGHLAMLQKHIDKLPLTKALLEEQCESMIIYKRRKLECVLNKLELAGERISISKVINMVGKSGIELDSELEGLLRRDD